MSHRLVAPLFLALALLVSTTPDRVEAGEIRKSFPFSLDRWYDLGVTDGSVTVHRIRIEHVKGGVTKSTFVRPGNTDFLETVRVVVEYTNRDPKRDWEAGLDVTWADAAGGTIDGVRDDESMDSDSRRDEITVTLSTLRYGLEKAKRLDVKIDLRPE